jgi:hypothetical protein
LRRLESDQLDVCWDTDVYICPFCDRSIGRDFDIVMMDAESLGSTRPKVGQTINVYAFMDKLKAGLTCIASTTWPSRRVKNQLPRSSRQTSRVSAASRRGIPDG